jgi:hypothetical protein
MRRTHYFNRDGDEVSASRALRDGVLQNGYSVRVPTIFRDGAPRQQFGDARAFWDRNKDTLVCTDVRRIGGVEGSKPGFRVLDNDYGRADKASALREHEQFLRDAWQGNRDAEVEEEDADGDRTECPDCAGSGYDQNGKTCRRCQGTGEVPDADNGDEEAERVADAVRRRRRPPDDDDDGRPPFGSQDRRTVDQIAHDHRMRMEGIYQDHAQWLSEQWKTK